MPFEVIMPKLSLTMKEGIITRWIKTEGEHIEIEEPLFELETEKINYEVKSPATGILSQILFPEDTAAPVGEVVAFIEEAGEAGDAAPEPAPEADISEKKDTIETDSVGETGHEADEEEFRAVPFIGMRKVISERMHQSLQETAQMTHMVEIDATELVNKRAVLKEQFPVSINDLIIKTTSDVLKKHPLINSRLAGNEIHVLSKINIGMAVSVPNGLIVPVIKNTGEKSLREIATETVELAQKARESKLTKEDVSEGTFTVTNLGMFGLDIFTPIINQPEAAILGIGRIVKKPAVFKGEVRIRQMMFLNLTFDHRIIDGAPAAEFLRDIQNSLEAPENLPD